ncbi:hypothetical protein [Bifidobacterium sp. ESL0704]|uniref:hypothetical protein n=1 Tax=Bifidobacterium sp. ESL0704 TaxID=2983219 RepID=UPI0023F97467|nr:hypothetical protein [Bifidobacterium sp. ESL0704]WEV53076.1 hypothetical protein OZX64_00810 [Bifidobacterium sp. ESL0704]
MHDRRFSATTIAAINPRESYIARLSGPNVMEAYVSDKKGNLAHGWYKNQNVTGAINDPYEPWHGKQDNFFNRNASGHELIPAQKTPDKGPFALPTEHSIFTLRHTAYWRPSNTKNDIQTRTLPKGTQVALPTDGNIAGKRYPLYIECDYWRSSENDTWHQFDPDGTPVPAGYLEFGFEYGCMPAQHMLT